MSGYIILEAVRADIPTVTLVRMLVNVGVDTLLGAVPALGDVFDAAQHTIMQMLSGDFANFQKWYVARPVA